MQIMNSFVTLEYKFVNNFKLDPNNRNIVVVSFHILQI